MQKVENFLSAVKNLKDIYHYSDNDNVNNVELSGMVALFQICFEQSWKAMKEVLENDGYAEAAIGSPRSILKTAYAAGLIRDEEAWLEVLVSRNQVSHAYNKAVAYDIIKKTKETYYNLFVELGKKLTENGADE